MWLPTRGKGIIIGSNTTEAIYGNKVVPTSWLHSLTSWDRGELLYTIVHLIHLIQNWESFVTGKLLS